MATCASLSAMNNPRFDTLPPVLRLKIWRLVVNDEEPRVITAGLLNTTSPHQLKLRSPPPPLLSLCRLSRTAVLEVSLPVLQYPAFHRKAGQIFGYIKPRKDILFICNLRPSIPRVVPGDTRNIGGLSNALMLTLARLHIENNLFEAIEIGRRAPVGISLRPEDFVAPYGAITQHEYLAQRAEEHPAMGMDELERVYANQSLLPSPEGSDSGSDEDAIIVDRSRACVVLVTPHHQTEEEVRKLDRMLDVRRNEDPIIRHALLEQMVLNGLGVIDRIKMMFPLWNAPLFEFKAY